MSSHRAYLDGTELRLSPKEHALPAFLTETERVDSLVIALRHKLGEALSIQAVRGVGFRLGVRSSRPLPTENDASPAGVH
ncbi:hypothetical protein [Streptomyces cylindrosporus]|uniref:hypothetical protein n=1 Tax=Streptomyces cylindrosporus TaxID=2927583 RepID=UPI0027E31D52|nr:hypothetical protein [Streptomyces cylindrosporus]